MEKRCGYWLFCISSSLGVYFGITIFFLFTFFYHNNHAGIWGLLSAMFAGICLHLKLLSSNHRLSVWYSIGQLHALAAFGFICFCLSLGFTSWYIIYAAYHHIPMLPVGGSFYLAAVWSAMTAKWTLCTFFMSYRYARIIRYNTPFLIIQEDAWMGIDCNERLSRSGKSSIILLMGFFTGKNKFHYFSAMKW